MVSNKKKRISYEYRKATVYCKYFSTVLLINRSIRNQPTYIFFPYIKIIIIVLLFIIHYAFNLLFLLLFL